MDNTFTEPLMPIWNAAVGGHWNIVKEWLRREPSLVNVTGRAMLGEGQHCEHLFRNQTFLNVAVRTGETEIMKFLIDLGADVNQNGDDNGNPLIYYAVEGGKTEVMRILIDAGADPTARDCAGGTPLHKAVFSGLTEIVKILIEAGEDVNVVTQGGLTPLHLASWFSNRPEIIKFLIDSGADLTAKYYDKTPLFDAAARNPVEILRYFVSHSADVHVKENQNNTLLHVAASSNDNVDVLEYFISQCVDIQAKNNDGKTPLDVADSEGKERILLEAIKKTNSSDSMLSIETTTNTDVAFDALRDLVYKKFGIIISDQKRSLVVNRLLKKMHAHGCETFEQYYKMIVKDKTDSSLIELANQMTTNHTFFFREPVHFDFFKSDILPWMVKKHETQNDNDLRIWCAAAGSGEEPYSIMITLLEYFGADHKNWHCGLLATDISEKALATATSGGYVDGRLHNVPPEILDKYFNKVPDGYEVIDQLKKEVIFRKFNQMNKTLPFKKKFDCIWCRNVMIYFDTSTKHELVNRMYDAMVSGGYLLIGHSETLDRNQTKWQYVKPGVYRKEE